MEKLKKTLKLLIPISLGIFLMWYFYDALSEKQRAELFSAFKQANYGIIFITFCFGWLSHFIRGVRWKILLDPLGYSPSIWSCYHSVMIGYIINLAAPRAGEISRAGYLVKAENTKFDKTFGTIVAERVVDLMMLGIVTLLFLILNLDSYEELLNSILNHPLIKASENSKSEVNIVELIGKIILYLIISIFGLLSIGFAFIKSVRDKIKAFSKSLIEGVLIVLKAPKRGLFVIYTLCIWILYVAMFYVAMFALPQTSSLGVDAALAGFIGGTVMLILVQGGIGVYPVVVGIVFTIYLGDTENIINPDAYAMGWIIWTNQTLLVILAGVVSMLFMSKIISKNKSDVELVSQNKS